ncbi:hypothetical protein BH11GEM1_BH11GEM1_04580 [soil metagenome]
MRPTAWVDGLNALAPAFVDAAFRGGLVLRLVVHQPPYQ